MEVYINFLNKYLKDDISVRELSSFLLLLNSFEQNDLKYYEYILSKLKIMYDKINDSFISKHKKRIILITVNNIISFYNDKLMDQICKNI
jgi:hypothetical protein